MKRTPQTLLTSLAALALVGTAFSGTAAATGKADAPGQAKKAEASQPAADRGRGGDKGGKPVAATVTEDNDTNDGGTPNNVVDAGDNKHPSGKDRSVENGGSGNQGKAQSDPDDDGRGPDRSNGGADKPGGAGGVDKADQDGNNGCGNDDDFEDDNEGWCGRKPAKDEAPKPAKPETPKPQAPKPEQPKSGNGNGNGGPGKVDTPKPGNGTADITVVADCRSVTVTSSKDISHVVVDFADGTSKKFDGLRGHRWSRTFDKDVAGATAKSATTRVSDAATCGAAAGAEQCPAGTVDMNGAAAGGCEAPATAGTPGTPTGEVLSGSAEAPVLPGPCVLAGLVGLTPMPADCVVPVPNEVFGESIEAQSPAPAEVLGESFTAAGPAATVSARQAGPAAVLSSAAGALAFTGVSVGTLLVAALLAIAAGIAVLRVDRKRSA